MSVSSFSQSNILGEDVLQMFSHQLDDEEQQNCEAVCRQWRRVQKELEKYRDICKDIQVKRNWRTGNFAKYISSPNSTQTPASWITMKDDCVVWNADHEYRREYSFLDTESMDIKEIPHSANWITVREILSLSTPSYLRLPCQKLEVLDSNKRVYSLYDAREDDFMLCDFVFGSKLFVVYSHNENSTSERIKIWKLENPPILLNDRTFSQFRDLEIFKVDERFIVARTISRTMYFISSETLEVLTSLSVQPCRYGYDEIYQLEYHRGLLFQSCGNGTIRILDVASGTYFNDVRLPLWNKDNEIIKFVPLEVFRTQKKPSAKLLDSWASSNSNFLVIGWKYWNTQTNSFYLSVYDLEAVKKRNSDPGSYLLYTLDIHLAIDCFLTNDSQIICYGRDYKNERKLLDINFVNVGLAASSALQENREVEDVSIVKNDRS